MERWLLALPGAAIVTLLLVFGLGVLLGAVSGQVQGAHPVRPGTGLIEDRSPDRPDRLQIPVRHVYPVPVWDPGAVAPDWQARISRPDIVVSAAPGLPARVVRAGPDCVMRFHIEEQGRVEALPSGCLDPARAQALSEALGAWAAAEPTQKLSALSVRLEYAPDP